MRSTRVHNVLATPYIVGCVVDAEYVVLEYPVIFYIDVMYQSFILKCGYVYSGKTMIATKKFGVCKTLQVMHFFQSRQEVFAE